MTYEDALKWGNQFIDNLVQSGSFTEDERYSAAVDFTKTAMECIERRICKKPVRTLRYHGKDSYYCSTCPICGEQLIMLRNCINTNCGQVIDWGDR